MGRKSKNKDPLSQQAANRPTAPDPALVERISVMRGLHFWFIFSMFVCGSAGVILYALFLAQPIRTCPVIYGLHVIYWLCVGSASVEIVLSVICLVWFIRFCQRGLNYKTITTDITAQASSIFSAPPTESRTELYNIPTVIKREKHVNPVFYRPRLGWLCAGGLILALIFTGIIVSLVFIQTFILYSQGRFKDDIISLFIEARINFHSNPPVGKENNAFSCWNLMQDRFGCCGLENYTDWKNQITTSLSLPASCYCLSNCDTTHASLVTQVGGRSVFKNGCRQMLHDLIIFELDVSRIYLCVVLAALSLVTVVAFGYTMYVAYMFVPPKPTTERRESKRASNPHARPEEEWYESRPQSTSPTNRSHRH